MYDDVELSRDSNRSSPLPSGSCEASGKGKGDKKSQKVEAQRLKKREKSVKHFKTLGVKMTDPYLQDIVAISASEKSKDKDMLPIAEGEKLQLVLREHGKMKQGLWLVEKADGSIGLADANLFAEGEGEIYETC